MEWLGDARFLETSRRAKEDVSACMRPPGGKNMFQSDDALRIVNVTCWLSAAPCLGNVRYSASLL